MEISFSKRVNRILKILNFKMKTKSIQGYKTIFKWKASLTSMKNLKKANLFLRDKTSRNPKLKSKINLSLPSSAFSYR